MTLSLHELMNFLIVYEDGAKIWFENKYSNISYYLYFISLMQAILNLSIRILFLNFYCIFDSYFSISHPSLFQLILNFHIYFDFCYFYMLYLLNSLILIVIIPFLRSNICFFFISFLDFIHMLYFIEFDKWFFYSFFSYYGFFILFTITK